MYKDYLGIKNTNIEFDILFFHNDSLKVKSNKNFIDNSNAIKILACDNSDKVNNYDFILSLPTTLKEINSVVENLLAKRLFNKNSSIKIKSYFLDKNEKKLIRNQKFLILTEKEIQLLELFQEINKPISKKEILSLVWHYSSDADTHTVETHIYRLRKKINEKFLDDNFILNNKDGYYLWKKEIKSRKIFFQQNIEKEWLSQKKEKEVSKEKKLNLF